MFIIQFIYILYCFHQVFKLQLQLTTIFKKDRLAECNFLTDELQYEFREKHEKHTNLTQ